ncbi:MAG: protein kinase [Deltaproteobacteria bacterium]|nr:protein kinase [Deltaproteobacteria bacterium]
MGGRAEDDGQAATLAQGATRPSRPEISNLAPGAMIGRYCLARRIGAGAMGVVWSAHDPQLDRSIAIKLVHPSLARSDEAAGRLLREARAMAKLSHRAVVTVHDAGDVDGQLFIAMELVDGTNLGTMLRARTAEEITDWRRWLAIMLEAGKGLEAAHKSGVLHRDFKPDNVLVDEAGRVAVGDFGLATLGGETFAAALLQRADRPLDLTTTGTLLGTPAYMSPQQLRSEPVDARADQFSFCVAAWEALHGTRPFSVKDSVDAVRELAATIETRVLPPPPPGSTVPDAVRTVLARGLSPDPAERWPHMTSLLAALEAARALDIASPAIVSPPEPRDRRRYLVLAAVIAVLGVVTAFALGRRHGADAPPPAEAMVSPAPTKPPAAVKKLFSVSFRTGLTLSPDGKRMALNSDRLQVRELDGTKVWSTVLPIKGDEVTYVEFDGNDLRFSIRRDKNVYRWSYAGDGATRIEIENISGFWYGRTKLGDVVHHYSEQLMTISDQGKEVRRWALDGNANEVATSPDGRRVAYIDAARFTGKLAVRNVETGSLLTSAEVVSPTSLTWENNETLLYATGTLEQPRIMRVSIAGGRFGTPTEVFGLDTGWFGPMAMRGNRLYLIQMQPSPRARLVDRTGGASSSRDLDHASVSLGWIGNGEYLSWSRNTHSVERRAEDAIELTRAVLDGEPANATNAGDVLITAVRRPAGREAIGVSRSTGAQLWRHQDGKTLAVRCAADLHAPCYAIRVHADEDQIVSLDPATGELGTTPIFRGKAEDVAVAANGKRLLVVGDVDQITELEPTGRVVSTSEVPMITVRSVAYDPRGGFLVGGTKSRNNYLVGQMRDGVWQLVMQSDDDILSFVRPSPDGNQVLVLARVYAPEVWQIQLATPTLP